VEKSSGSSQAVAGLSGHDPKVLDQIAASRDRFLTAFGRRDARCDTGDD